MNAWLAFLRDMSLRKDHNASTANLLLSLERATPEGMRGRIDHLYADDDIGRARWHQRVCDMEQLMDESTGYTQPHLDDYREIGDGCHQRRNHVGVS